MEQCAPETLLGWIDQNVHDIHSPRDGGVWAALLAEGALPKLGCGGLAAALGKIAGNEIRVVYAHVTGLAPELARRATMGPVSLDMRPLVVEWARCLAPMSIDPCRDAARASSHELAEIEEFGLACMTIHGVLASSGHEGSYFSFCRMQRPGDPDVVRAIELLVPHLHLGLLTLHRQHCAQVVRSVTESERLLLAHLAAGKSNKQIAAALMKSPATIRNQLFAVSARLNAGSRLQLIERARECGALGFNLGIMEQTSY